MWRTRRTSEAWRGATRPGARPRELTVVRIDRCATALPVAGQGPAKPSAENQAVLDQLAALGAKPLETLTPPQVRQQPSPADAVKALLEKQGKSTAPEAVGSQLFRNTGGRRFVESSADAGPAFARAEIGRAAAFGDVDNDGDVDVLVTNNSGPVRLLLNNQAGTNKSLQIRLEQPGPNRFAHGAWVGVERTKANTLWRRVKTDGSYLSASDPRLHFGLASSEVSGIVVQWPDGQRERFAASKSVRSLTLRRGSGTR